MQPIAEENLVTSPPMQSKPQIRSFDSGEECSLDHFLALYLRVQEEFTCVDDPEMPLAR